MIFANVPGVPLTHDQRLCNAVCGGGALRARGAQDEQVVKFQLWNKRLVQVKSRAQLRIALWTAQKKLARQFYIALVESALKMAHVTRKSRTRRLDQILISTTEKVFEASDRGNVIDAPLFQ